MHTSRQTNASHWKGVGRRAASLGIPLERALTTNLAVNAYITEGYNSAPKVSA